MKLGFNPSPNYHCGSSTKQIMKELTLALVAVYVFAFGYQAVVHGMGNVLHVALMTLTSLASALAVEFLWAKFVVKSEPISYIKKSFGWVTALILVLMLPANMGLYPVMIGTIFAIVIVKLLFGGFGANIFNPAAAGCAVIFSYFATGKVADIVTGATPTASISSSYSWIITDTTTATSFLDKFGGMSGMLLGMYDGALGETCTLLLVVVGIALAVRKVIDWRVPVFYVTTVFVLAAIYGLCMGAGLWYPVFHVLTGGLMFGAVFMATDPVTNPTSNQGRIIFAIGCGILTVLIRVKGNLAEGVLYSILLMNMLTPWIERACAGVSYKTVKKSAIMVAVVALVGALLMPVVAMANKANQEQPSVSEPTNNEPVTPPSAVSLNLADAYTGNAAVVTDTTEEGDDVVYTVETAGFSGETAKNVVVVKINKTTRAIASVEVTTFSDTPHVGDAATTADYLSVYVNKSIDEATSVDAQSGATITSTSIAAAVHAAVVAFDQECAMVSVSGNDAPSYGLPFDGDYASCAATITNKTENGDTTTYTVSASGFPGNNANVFEVVVDNTTKTIVSVSFVEFNDTASIGDAANNETFLNGFVGLDATAGTDAVSGATFTSKAVVAAVVAALND